MAIVTVGSDAETNGLYLPFDIFDIWQTASNVDVISASYATSSAEVFDGYTGKVELYGSNFDNDGGVVQIIRVQWNDVVNMEITGLNLDFDTLKDAINEATASDNVSSALTDVFKKVNFELDLSDSTVDNYVSGTGGSDVFKLGSGADNFYMDGGKDDVDLGAGNDQIWVFNTYGYTAKGLAIVDGGKGLDQINLDNAWDEGNTDAHMLDLMGVSKFNKGTVEFKNVENVLGGAGTDTIYGTDKANLINGGQGDDVITGRGGADTLVGWTGKDTFVYADVEDSGLDAKHDVITDFTHGEDTLDFSLLHPDTRKDKLAFIETDKFDGGKGELHFKIYNEAGDSNDHTIVEVDMNGDKTADLQIYLDDVMHLNKGDFMF